MVIVFLSCRILIYPWFFYVHSSAKGLAFVESVIQVPPRCALCLLVGLLPQIYWFRIMLNGAIKLVKEKFQTTTQQSDLNESNNAKAAVKRIKSD